MSHLNELRDVLIREHLVPFLAPEGWQLDAPMGPTWFSFRAGDCYQRIAVISTPSRPLNFVDLRIVIGAGFTSAVRILNAARLPGLPKKSPKRPVLTGLPIGLLGPGRRELHWVIEGDPDLASLGQDMIHALGTEALPLLRRLRSLSGMATFLESDWAGENPNNDRGRALMYHLLGQSAKAVSFLESRIALASALPDDGPKARWIRERHCEQLRVLAAYLSTAVPSN